ncbi:MAG TPA: Holliday junction branch migration protein RuvA [Actinomycetota bacterium]|nr:Holliday junction branch migration protein RuvA [Actinomycetota bacterium]
MIASLNGVVAEVTGAAAVVEVGGVGYLVYAPGPVLAGLVKGQPARLLTHLAVREDALTLYGFRTADQREVFQTLLGVTGVGPKLAVAVLSVLDPDELRRAVATGDLDALTSVPGVGKRGAQRMLLELRDRLAVVAVEPSVPSAAVAEVRAALTGLGYTPAELRGVIEEVATPGATVEAMVRAALKMLAGASAGASAGTGAGTR